jgi:SAM-dependent methyltransferase
MAEARVTADAVHVPAGMEGSVDVRFDGRRVWSVAAADGEAAGDGTVSVPWPEALRRFLDGRAEVVLRHHQEDLELFRGELAFGTGQGRVRVQDDAGRPLAVTKYGRLNRPFDAVGQDVVDDYLDRVDEALEVLAECGLQGYVCWGTLLGAVRAGRIIGHDVDADIGYLSPHTTMADVIRESFRVERALRARGWQVVRENAGFLALFVEQPDGARRNLDVFAGWIVDGWFHQVHDLRARLPRSAIEPLSTVELEGRAFPAPADPAAWLEAAYGPGWRTPDPAFSFPHDRATKRRIQGWLGGLRGRRDAWGKAYGAPDEAGDAPSEFARWVAEQESDPTTLLVDLGCGRGNDALWFAGRGREVWGVDVVPSVVRRATRRARRDDLPVGFEELNFADLRHALMLGARLARSGPVTLYSRRLVGDLRPEVEGNLWRTVEMAMRAGGRLFLEFVTGPVPAGAPGHAGPRLPGAPADRVVEEIARRGGRVVVQEDLEEPVEPAGANVCRLIAEWSR